MQGISKFMLACLVLVVAFDTAIAQDAEQTKSEIDEPKIEWVHDLDEALKQSEADGRPVIAYFTFDGCVWCKRLEKACFHEKDVVELSRKFIWVYVDRDETPEIPKRLNVSAYPSLLTLGKELENIFRFKSYQEPPEFVGNLNTALERFALYRDGKEWMLPPKRPEKVIDTGRVKTVPAPSDAVGSGITVEKKSIWVAQGSLFRMDASSGKVIAKHELPSSVGDLCSDGKQLFAVTYGWTAGKPIYVIDPEDGKVLREIITEANKENRSHGAKGIAFRDGYLYVLSGMVGKVFKIDPDDGEIVKEIQLDGTWLSGLDFEEDNFVTGGRTHVSKFDSTNGEVVARIACNYPIRNIAAHRGELLMMEQPIFGFGRNHERIQVWPKTTQIYRWTK